MGWIASGRLGAAWLLACASILLPVNKAAKAAGTTMRAQTTVIRPFTLVKTHDLSFGNVGANVAGTVSVEPATDVRTVTGVTAAGGLVQAARFLGYGSPNSMIRVRWVTNPPYILTRVGGTETMQMDRITTNGSSNQGGRDPQRIPASGFLDIRFAGRLQVAANQAPGVYEGTFFVTVDYP